LREIVGGCVVSGAGPAGHWRDTAPKLSGIALAGGAPDRPARITETTRHAAADRPGFRHRRPAPIDPSRTATAAETARKSTVIAPLLSRNQSSAENNPLKSKA
jgi:hypothetical protein